tara:strand:- start:219 stop:866 length:648 start_codon:yes stop_codon:yes gene_type:complete
MLNIVKKQNEDEIFNLNKAFLNILQDKGIASPKTLSEMTGIDKATISRQMSNKQALSLNHIARYSEVFKVPKGKFIEEHTPFYWIVGYVEREDGKVSGRHEEDPQKVIFTNEWEKSESEKILFDKQTNHLLRYDLELNQQTIPYKDLEGSYCFVRTKKDYMSGYIGFVTNLNRKEVSFIYLNGKNVKVNDFFMVYSVTATHNMKFSTDKIAIVDG